MNDESEKSQERRLRELASQLGYELKKDRPEGRDMNHQGGYMVVNSQNIAEAGENFALTLDDVERFLADKGNRP